jgi:hypothetical protein
MVWKRGICHYIFDNLEFSVAWPGKASYDFQQIRNYLTTQTAQYFIWAMIKL